MNEYQEAERKTEREARRETSRTGAALVLKSGVGAAEEHPVWRARQIMSKRPRASTSQVSPARRKLRKGLRLKLLPGCLK